MLEAFDSAVDAALLSSDKNSLFYEWISVAFIKYETFQKRHFPVCADKFNKVPNLRFWEMPTFDALEAAVLKIEKAHGRLKPTIVAGGPDEFRKKKPTVLTSVENGRHLRYDLTHQLNFYCRFVVV